MTGGGSLLRRDAVRVEGSHAEGEVVRDGGSRERVGALELVGGGGVGTGERGGRGKRGHAELTTELVDFTAQLVVLADEGVLLDLRESGRRGGGWTCT